MLFSDLNSFVEDDGSFLLLTITEFSLCFLFICDLTVFSVRCVTAFDFSYCYTSPSHPHHHVGAAKATS